MTTPPLDFRRWSFSAASRRYYGLGVAVLAALATLSATSAANAQAPPQQSLKTAAAEHFRMGVGVGMSIVGRPSDWPLLTSQFDIVTPENCMKASILRPSEEQFNFDRADAFVEFAQQHELKVVGHCLLWATDERTPAWMLQDGEQVASKQLLLQRMQTHIDAVVGRYRGRVAEWDVVNEALADGDGQYLRDSGWTRNVGEEFLVKAFEFAHAADPDAVLIYNDYRCDLPEKRAKLIRMLKMLEARGAPIDAVGLQGHYELDAIPLEGLEETLIALRELGLKAVLSELDLDVVTRSRWWADDGAHRAELRKYNPYRDACPRKYFSGRRTNTRHCSRCCASTTTLCTAYRFGTCTTARVG